MKKKPVTTLVLLVSLVIGADMTFGKDLKKGDKIKGRTLTIYKFSQPLKESDIDFKRGNGKWAKQKNHTAEFVNMYNQLGYFLLEEGDTLTVNNTRQHVFIDVWTTSSTVTHSLLQGSDGDGKGSVRITAGGKDLEMEVIGGRTQETQDGRIDHLMTFVSSVDLKKIKNWVDGLKKSRKTFDQLADEIISQKKTKAGFLSAAAGLAGPFTIPEGSAEVFAQWIIQAEMAYALTYAYEGKFGDTLIDLCVLFGDDSRTKSTIKAVRKVELKAVSKTQVKAAVGESKKTVTLRLSRDLTSKLGEKIRGNAWKGYPVISSVINDTTSFKDIDKFAARAKAYYSN